MYRESPKETQMKNTVFKENLRPVEQAVKWSMAKKVPIKKMNGTTATNKNLANAPGLP